MTGDKSRRIVVRCIGLVSPCVDAGRAPREGAVKVELAGDHRRPGCGGMTLPSVQGRSSGHVGLPAGSQRAIVVPALDTWAVSGCLADYGCAFRWPRALERLTQAWPGGVYVKSMRRAPWRLATLRRRRHVRRAVLGMVPRGGRQVGRCPCAQALLSQQTPSHLLRT